MFTNEEDVAMRIPAIIAALSLSLAAPVAMAKDVQTAIFAGGCFWCVEKDMDEIDGVLDTVSGFTGGNVANPSYKEVSRGGTGHREAVQVTFDADVISFEDLTHRFLRTVDVTDAGGQFCDRGHQYSTAIFATSQEQIQVAEDLVDAAEAQLGRDVVTPVELAGPFYEADEYHQNYHTQRGIILTRFGPLTKATAYKKYREACGRDVRVKEVWGSSAYAGS